MVFSKQGRYDEALNSLLAASDCDGSSAQPHSSLAAIYNALDDRDNAARHYHVALQLAPHRPNVLLNYAMFLHRHGRVVLSVSLCFYTVLYFTRNLVAQKYNKLNRHKQAFFFKFFAQWEV